MQAKLTADLEYSACSVGTNLHSSAAIRALRQYSVLFCCLAAAWCCGLIGCATPSGSAPSAKVHCTDEAVQFCGLKFNFLSSEPVALGAANTILILRVRYENLGQAALEATFQPRFAILDSADRVFEPASAAAMMGAKVSMELAQSQLALLQPLNPGVARDVAIAFELPAATASGDLRLRVMCPERARAGFMMQQYTLYGPYFFYGLSVPGSQSATEIGAVTTRAAQQSKPSESRPVLRNGMTRQEVYDRWGAPEHQTDLGTVSVWAYTADGMVMLQFESDKLVNYSPPFKPRQE